MMDSRPPLRPLFVFDVLHECSSEQYVAGFGQWTVEGKRLTAIQ